MFDSTCFISDNLWFKVLVNILTDVRQNVSATLLRYNYLFSVNNVDKASRGTIGVRLGLHSTLNAITQLRSARHFVLMHARSQYSTSEQIICVATQMHSSRNYHPSVKR